MIKSPENCSKCIYDAGQIGCASHENCATCPNWVGPPLNKGCICFKVKNGEECTHYVPNEEDKEGV